MTGLSDLAGRVAVVTGGAMGMGRGIAERLQAAGMQVAIADIDPAALAQTASETGMSAFRVDVRDAGSVSQLAAQVIDRFGSVDVVCNNAGVGPVGRIESMTLDDWHWVLDINLWGVIHGVKAFLPHLLRNPRGGYVVNTASMSGLLPGSGFGAYTVSKYGVVALSEVLALEMAETGAKIGVSVLLPGPTRTEIARSLRNRAADAGSGLVDLDLNDVDLFGGTIPWKTPLQIGDVVLEGITSGALYLFTHPELSQPIFDRFDRIRQASTPV